MAYGFLNDGLKCFVCLSAIASLDKIHWKGKILKVSMSKHQNVQLPREGLPVKFCATEFFLLAIKIHQFNQSADFVVLHLDVQQNSWH